MSGDEEDSNYGDMLRELIDEFTGVPVEEQPQKPETDREAFEREMRDWGICYADWAGGEQVWAGDDDVIKSAVYPDSGDWVMYDARGRTGFIGTCHDGWSSTYHVKLKKKFKHGYDLTLPEIPRRVSTIDLMKRYHWIVVMFMNYAHRESASPYPPWESEEALDADFEAERADFETDPYLALYWLLHFGLCNDARYDEIAADIRKFGHEKTLANIRYTLAFFDETEITYDMPLAYGYSDKPEDFEHLFLKRRANLLYLTSSCRYYGGGERRQNIWLSVALVSGADEYAIRRMRWVFNSLKKYDLWAEFDDWINGPEADAIAYVSYVRALRPGRDKPETYADALVSELVSTHSFWKARSKRWAQVMLWDVRGLVSDIAAFETACDLAFQSDMESEWYPDVREVFGLPIENIEEKRAAITAFEALIPGLKESVSKEDTVASEKKFAASDALLTSLPDDVIDYLIDSVSNGYLKEALLRHLFLSERHSRHALILKLYPRAPQSDYDLPRLFPGTYPVFIRDEQDDTFEILKQVLTLPDTAYVNDYWAKNARESACAMICSAAHFPPVFDHMLHLIDTDAEPRLPSALFENIFHRKFDKATDPIMALSDEQVIRLLDRIVAFIARHPGEDENREARRVIYYCAHPAAIPWAEARINSVGFYKPFVDVQYQFETLAEALKNDLEGLLHWHNEDAY